MATAAVHLQLLSAPSEGMQENETSREHCEREFKRKLSRALLHFQDRLLEANITPGSLCQVRCVRPLTESNSLACLADSCGRAWTASLGCRTMLLSTAVPHLLGAVASVMALATVTCLQNTSWFAGLDARGVRGRRMGAKGKGKLGNWCASCRQRAVPQHTFDTF